MSLEDKKFLIIDDCYDSVECLDEVLSEKQAYVINTRTIDKAVAILKNEEIDFVVIDLFLPRGYREVEKYAEEKMVDYNKHNQGELLGYYLDNKHKSTIPYIYFTSQTGFYQGKTRRCFSKAPRNIDSVVFAMEDLLGCNLKSQEDLE